MAKEQPFRLEATYVPGSNRACERSAKTRSLAQQPACKNLDCIDQSPVITVKAAYTSVTERANSRSAETRSHAQKPPHKDLESKWPKSSHLDSRPLMFRVLTGHASALPKRVHWRSNLRVRTLTALTKARSSQSRPLTLRLLNAPIHAL